MMDRDPEAIVDFDKVLDLNGDFHSAYGDLQMSYEKLEDKKNLEKTIQRAALFYPSYLLRNPDDSRARQFYAFTLKRLGRLEEAKVELDANRVEQELIMLAQKSDVAEELDRLDSHVKETQKIMKKGGACGRRLDFMMQEFNRESNTLASKSINTEITASAVELKVLIEQMREQIQNIE